MKNYWKKSILFVLTPAIFFSCNHGSMKDGQTLEEGTLLNNTTLTDEEKQTLLAEKYRECHFVEDKMELNVIKGSVPTLIPTPSEKWIYGYLDEINEDDSENYKFIMAYDLEKDSLYFLVPPGSADYGESDILRSRYKDYKLYKNHLYLIHADLGHLYLPYIPYSIYYINVNNFLWYTVSEVESYGRETGFVGDKIKAQTYYISKESEEDSWENEYADSIQWIEME